MAKRIFLLLYLLCSFVCAFSQDIITRTDGVVIKASIVELNPPLLRFRLFNSADSLVYQINTKDVKSIQMADGSTRTFTQPTITPTVTQDFDYENDFGRTIVTFAPLDLIFKNLSFAYERILPSGKVGLKFPVMFGVDGSNSFSEGHRENIIFGTGIDINFYPSGQGKFRYYIAPSINYRRFSAYYYDPRSTTYEPKKLAAHMLSAAVKSGGYYMINNALFVSADLGLGLRFFKFPNEEYFHYNEYDTRFFIPGNLYIGFRF